VATKVDFAGAGSGRFALEETEIGKKLSLLESGVQGVRIIDMRNALELGFVKMLVDGSHVCQGSLEEPSF